MILKTIARYISFTFKNKKKICEIDIYRDSYCTLTQFLNANRLELVLKKCTRDQ